MDTSGKYLTCDEEGFLTLPDELLNKMGWKEGTLLDFSIQKDGTIIVKSIEEDNGKALSGQIEKAVTS
jgi:bifunctional DNA-binding transcriptional regulator/antitoxin component of YhaV-PrlF toxin-antitoxin module